MPESTVIQFGDEQIDLKDRKLALFLAWLIPGAGHFYQGRSVKGSIFSVCILTTFFFGLYLGEGRVVYASWGLGHQRLQYIPQAATGLVAMPAIIQWTRARNDKAPLWGGFMAPPRSAVDEFVLGGDELDQLHKRLNRFFEFGTVYTMVAGLLNILAMYDAYAGPADIMVRKEDEEDNEDSAGESGRGPPDEAKA